MQLEGDEFNWDDFFKTIFPDIDIAPGYDPSTDDFFGPQFNRFIELLQGYFEDQDQDDIDRILRSQELEEFLSVLYRYENGDATLDELMAVDTGYLSEVDGWTDFTDALFGTGPDLSELIAEYGEDVVNDARAKYDELVDFIGNVPDDPVGSIKKIIDIYMEGVAGVPPECTNVTGGPLDEWYKRCVTVGVLIEIGIPGLPGGLGSIFRGATIGEIEEALEKIGKKFEDIVNGTPTCGEDGNQECTPENILGDLAREVIDNIGSIFEDAEGNITVESVLGKLGGIFGSVLGGIIYDQFKDLINDEIENVIGIPVIPFAPLPECEDKGLETIETSPGQYECGECKQEGFTPTGPQGECVDPNAVDPFDETRCVEETYFNENKADCEAAGYVNCAGGENSQAQETTGGIIKGTLDDCDVIQDPQCSDVGTYDNDPNSPTFGDCVCPEGYEFEVETGGTCGEKTQAECRNNAINPDACNDCGDDTTPDQHINGDCDEDLLPDEGPDECDEGEVLHKGSCYRIGASCYADAGETGCFVGSIHPDGSCKCQPYESCPEGSEVDEPQYNENDVDQSGTFTLDGKEYTYEPCNPSVAPVEVVPPENTCDNNAVNYPDCNQCENGEHPDAHVGSDCGEPLKEVGTNPGDACDFYGDVGVVDKNGDCKRVGMACNRIQYGYSLSDNCETGFSFLTQKGVIDSSGDCVCNPVCDDPNRQRNLSTGACLDTCKAGWTKDSEGNCTVEDPDYRCPNGATVESDCEQCPQGKEFNNGAPNVCVTTDECKADDAYTDPTKAAECGKVECPPNSVTPYADSLDQCVPVGVTECVTPDGTPTGATPESGCEECPTGQDFNTEGICVDTVLPETCNDPNAVNNGQEGPCECKPGFTKDEEGLCFQSGDVCDNGATVESGCDTCPDGTSVLEYEDGMCPSEPTEECANGATDYPACTTCPSGQSMDEEGNCTDCSDCSCAEYAAANPEECITQPPPETGGGGGGGGGGMLGGGSFTPFLAGISYTPQAVPEPPAPAQKDYMAELDNLIKRSLFEGMA